MKQTELREKILFHLLASKYSSEEITSELIEKIENEFNEKKKNVFELKPLFGEIQTESW